jgi:hypothetical protein
MTPDELRQSAVFHAVHRYTQQRFELPGVPPARLAALPHVLDSESGALFTGDIMSKLPPEVEPVIAPSVRRAIWRQALSPTLPDAYVDAYQFKHWCGATVLCNLKDAGLAAGLFWKDAIGFVGPAGLRIVTKPEPGDIAFFEKNQHYAHVESVDLARGVFTSVDGNQGKTLGRPGLKRYIDRPLRSAYCFYSISKLLEAVQ